jgi:hypothetical protein
MEKLFNLNFLPYSFRFKLKSKENSVMASPLKNKLDNEPINSNDIKNFIKQSNSKNNLPKKNP